MAHPLALGGRAPGDESHNLQPAPASEQLGRMLLVAAADLSDHDKVRRRRVCLEQLDDILERQAEHRIAADANDG